MHTHTIPCQSGKMKILSPQINYLSKVKIDDNNEYHSLEQITIPSDSNMSYVCYKNVFFNINIGEELNINKCIVLDMIYICSQVNNNIATFTMLTPPLRTCHQGSLPLFNNGLIHYKSGDSYLIPMHGIYDSNTSNTGIGLKHQEYYGFYYITNKNGYIRLLNNVLNHKVTAISFDEDPKIHELGFWYNEHIIIN